MQLRHLVIVFLFFPAVTFYSLLASDQGLLKPSDIHPIMRQMLTEHVQDKDITPAVLQRSFKLYIDEIDPERVYFIQAEIEPFVVPSKADLDRYLQEYNKGDMTVFRNINMLGQRAIQRSRDWRHEMEQQWNQLVEEALKPGALSQGLAGDLFAQVPFAVYETELKGRLHDALVRYIALQVQRFGEKAVRSKPKRVLSMFERHIRLQEGEFVFENAKGESLPTANREHFLTLHVLKALAAALDSHSAFFNSVEAQDMRARLEKGFQGIGVVLQEGLDGVIITKLVEGGPAAKSGLIKENDLLVEVDGRSIQDAPFSDVLEMIRGAEGSSVKLGIKRTEGEGPEQFFTVGLKREEIVVNDDRVDVSYEQFNDGIIGKVTLYSFYESDNGISSEGDMKAALSKLKKIGPLKGLVFDLRQNTGGFLIQAIKVAGLFISNGVVVTAKYSNGVEKVYRDIDSRIYYQGPLVILTSRMTASAAEIVAECLQDYGTAIIVGDEHTYGKGSIQHQTVTDKHSTSFFKVTVGKYYTVSGKTPQIQGVKADIVVPTVLGHEKIGEEYLDYPLASDTIAPEFQDNLQDIALEIRSWYVHHYVPTLQKRSDLWRKMLPILKANSARRLEQDQDYQAMLNKNAAGLTIQGIADQLEHKRGTAKDYQMAEGVNIIKDMITLQAEENK